MKTIALLLLSSCLSLWGQTSATDTNFAVDTALRDEILRRAVEQYQTNDQQPAPAAATNTASPVMATAPPAAPPATTPAARPAVAPAVAANPPGVTAPVVPTVTVPTTDGQSLRLPGSRLQPPATSPSPTLPAAVPAAAPVTAPVAAPVAAAPVKVEEPADQSMDFPSIDLNTFLSVYASTVGRTLLHGPLPNATISLRTQKPLTKTEFIQAMDTVLAMNNITIVNQGANFVQVLATGETPGAGVRFSTNRAEDIPESMQYVNQIVQLKYTKPSEIAPLLAPFAKIPNSVLPIEGSSMLVIRDYAANVKRMMELIQKVDVIAPLEYDQEIIPIKYAKVSDIASALGSLGAGTSASIGSRGNGGTTSTRGGLGGAGGYSPGGVGGVGGIGAQGATSPFGTGGALGGAARGNNLPGSLQNRLAGVAGSLGRGSGTGDIPIFLGPTKIISDERSHSLLVLAGHQDMVMIKSIVKKLDVVLAQVLIQAIIMEVNLDNELNYGVSYLQTQQSTPGNYFKGIGAINNGPFLNAANFTSAGSNGIAGLPSGFSYAAALGNDFQATATAIATDSRINVLSKPQIQTSDGVPASFKVGDTIPYVTGTYFGGLNGQASSQYTQTFVGIDLEVTPQINSEGLVVMDISQDIQQLGPSTTIDGNAVPTTTQRSAASTVSVKDGDTIILGGFVSTTKSKSHSGVPLLMDIPVLGNLFRSSSDSDKRVELIVLIRPTVLPTPEAAAVAATHERNNMPGLKAADREAQIEENKRLKQADKITVPNVRQ